ncbi:hypothetical protein CAT25_00330 [Acinetobacter pittii]|uniref:hypothetical protein n=1 Tax=Acinetobacter pittii TaxID=48296 RepID=UPI00070FA57E|nr:hypothetical protein [Acinetobacter pittii]DAI74980.1 MAG TPA: hypothetical protein [Caudoviricetes sp.]KRJ75236.1 hypothetical protein APC93_09935 [Acinetobacter pittii]MBJ9449618.1 hypothetical protein [Acinetobacter pittii]MDX8202111.1 hypothetical protein [Acinetobacter pittii]MDX8227703.1 hypothetical protein [Acinetobacter pittii]
MNKSAFSISIMIIGIILIFLLFSIFGILYFCWGNAKAVQDSLSTTGSIFSAIATLGAACVAAFLFNDWRTVHSTESDTQDGKNLQNTIFAIKGLLENEMNFIEIHPLMLNSEEFKTQAKINIEELHKRYWPLRVDMSLQISIFNNNVLNGDKLLDKSEDIIFQHYFYTITSLLEAIHLGKHESDKIVFDNLVNSCKNKEKIIFDDLVNKINGLILKKIKPIN